VAVFVARRLALAVAVLLAFSFLSFLFFASKFEPLKQHAVLPQYWRWLRGVPDGHSLAHGITGLPLLPPLLHSLGHTAALLALALVLVAIFAVAIGTTAAAVRGSALDVGLRAGSYVAWAIPAFLLALILQQAMDVLGSSHGLGPFPIAGWPGTCPAGIGLDAGTISPCPAAGTGLDYLANVLRSVTLPAVALAGGFVGLHSRYLRSSLIGALAMPYTTTARAKGVPERLVVVRHALRNSQITFVAALLADFGAVFGAALAVDWVFQLNGIGTLFFDEVNPAHPSIDAYAVQLLLLVTGALLLTSSLLSELVVGWLDPRARFD
jgi:peptide/nickel transport system permease protein